MNKKYRLIVLLLGLLCMVCNRVYGFGLIAPVHGKVLTNNMPTLSWSKTDCQKYEVWVDGIKMETLPARQQFYTVFPLSFGLHKWEVRAVNGDKTVKTGVETFSIIDKPITDVSENSQLLRDHWYVASSLTVGKDGRALSSRGVAISGWAQTTLPATVLTALVRNGYYPNPYFALNNMRIPDMNDAYNAKYGLLKYSHIPNHNPWTSPYWYRTEFSCNKALHGKHLWLNISELNHRAEIWLNGVRIADTIEVAGMERLFRFDITKQLNRRGRNVLAIAVYPPLPAGEPAPDPLTALADPGCNMGDGMLSHSYTKWDTMGWDWQPPVRDRDMGITEDVYLSTTNDIELDNLYISSDINLPDTATADVTISADVINHSSKRCRMILKACVSNGTNHITFEVPVVLAPASKKSFLWDKRTIRQLHIVHPKLWWPFGYGGQNLYAVRLMAEASGLQLAEVSDTFGIRKVETYIGENERIFKINGRKIYPKGGNWVIDMMLNWTASRYEKEILLTRNAHLNLLRIWGPTGVAPKPLYRAADKYGVLIWQDFLNDYWGTFKNTPGYQPEIGLFEKATTAIVKKYRNHPSLIIWCGGNEGVNPREQLITGKILPMYDGRDSRYYLKSSNGDGLHGGGPYHTLEPKDYFLHPKMTGFSSEIGPSGVPVAESIIKFMPDYGKDWLTGRFPLDGVWAYHDANDWPGNDTRKFTAYDTMLRHYYGDIDTLDTRKGLEDYVKKAQSVNYDAYRSSIEAINRGLWGKSSGIVLWKSNSSWPSLAWQVYDWYLQAHAGYYSVKKAGEPLHVQWNRDNNSISVVNVSGADCKNLTLSVDDYNVATGDVRSHTEQVNVGNDQVVQCTDSMEVTPDVRFVRLQLRSADGVLLSENIYWVQSSDNFRSLQSMPSAALSVAVARDERKNGRHIYAFDVHNDSRTVAYMLSMRIVGEQSRTELLPSLWSDNYICLMPGEKRTLSVELFDEDMTERPLLEYQTYNSDKKWINLK